MNRVEERSGRCPGPALPGVAQQARAAGGERGTHPRGMVDMAHPSRRESPTMPRMTTRLLMIAAAAVGLACSVAVAMRRMGGEASREILLAVATVIVLLAPIWGLALA